MNDCSRFEEHIVLSADGLLSEDEQTVLDQHLDACPACAALLHQHALLRSTMDGWEEKAPPSLAAGVMYKIQYTDQGSGRRRRFAFGGFSFAAAALAIFFLFQTFTSNRSPILSGEGEAIHPAAFSDTGDSLSNQESAQFEQALSLETGGSVIADSEDSRDAASAKLAGEGAADPLIDTGNTSPLMAKASVPPNRVVRLKAAHIPAELEDFETTPYDDRIEISVPVEEFDVLWETLQDIGAELVKDAPETDPASDVVLIIFLEE